MCCSFQEFDSNDGCGCLNVPKRKPKKRSKIKLLKERIRQFSIWYFEQQEHVERDMFRRRVERKKVKTRHVATHIVRIMQWMYALDAIAWIIGLTFVLCSTVESFGQYTPFYKSKQLYQILGLVILLFAVLLLFFVTGFKHRVRTKHQTRKLNPVTKKCTCNLSAKSETNKDNSKDTSEDSGNEEDIEVKSYQTNKSAHRKQSKNNSTVCVPSEKRQPLYFYKNVDSRQCSIELSPLPSAFASFANESPKAEKDEVANCSWKNRKAWTKSKWMRVESEDSSDDDGILGACKEEGKAPFEVDEQYGSGIESFAQNRRKLFKMKAQNTSSNESIDIFHPINRNISTKSKVSQASTVSTCSETAPLVKR